MRKMICFCLCVMLWASAPPPRVVAEEGAPRFIGVLTQDLTVRATKSQSGKRVALAHAGDTVEILALEKDWFWVRLGDAEGYIVGALVGELESLDPENDPVPPAYLMPNPKTFQARYRAKSSEKKLALRATPEEDGKLLATIYEDETLDVGELDPEWTVGKKGKNLGFVRTELLTALETLDPYQPLPPGTMLFPYAATVQTPTDVTGTLQGEPGTLQSLPVDAVVAVGEPDANGDVLLPYKRTVGRLRGDALSLEAVVPANQAEPGDLLAVFATFFTAESDLEISVGRLHNIEKGVALFDGAVLASGGRFSFNEVAGPYTRGNGYEKGPIINYTSDKKTGYGGGICQVSTTLYNVALQLPMKIRHWQPHSSYGIDYAPVQFDAAVGKGGLDLIFENTLDYAVRISMNVWDGVVTVRMYRADEGVETQDIEQIEIGEEAEG